jgi:hypothetical protein
MLDLRTVDEGGSAPNRSDASSGRRRVNGNQRCSPPPLVPTGEVYDAMSEVHASVGPRELPGDEGSWFESVGEGGSSFAHAVRNEQNGQLVCGDGGGRKARIRDGLRTGSCDDLVPG